MVDISRDVWILIWMLSLQKFTFSKKQHLELTQATSRWRMKCEHWVLYRENIIFVIENEVNEIENNSHCQFKWHIMKFRERNSMNEHSYTNQNDLLYPYNNSFLSKLLADMATHHPCNLEFNHSNMKRNNNLHTHKHI